MILIPLEATPNQSLTVRLGTQRYEIRLRDVGGVMAVDVSRGDVPLVRGARAVAGTPLLPYRYLEDGQGNLAFLSGERIPYWTDFGTRTQLVYTSGAELEAIRGGA